MNTNVITAKEARNSYDNHMNDIEQNQLNNLMTTFYERITEVCHNKTQIDLTIYTENYSPKVIKKAELELHSKGYTISIIPKLVQEKGQTYQTLTYVIQW